MDGKQAYEKTYDLLGQMPRWYLHLGCLFWVLFGASVIAALIIWISGG